MRSLHKSVIWIDPKKCDRMVWEVLSGRRAGLAGHRMIDEDLNGISKPTARNSFCLPMFGAGRPFARCIVAEPYGELRPGYPHVAEGDPRISITQSLIKARNSGGSMPKL
jgi:hypothetical protein